MGVLCLSTGSMDSVPLAQLEEEAEQPSWAQQRSRPTKLSLSYFDLAVLEEQQKDEKVLPQVEEGEQLDLEVWEVQVQSLLVLEAENSV